MHLPDNTSFNRHDSVPPARHLTALEQRVILLARRDVDSGTGKLPGSPFGRLLARLTGIEAPQPLADDRLEALRRFACLERRGDRRAGALAESLLHLGFSSEALASAASIARG